MTLYKIFYQHTNWWNDPNLGKDTQGKFGEVIKEMEACASEYAKDIKDVGDRWKWIIQNEARELCRLNHYSFALTGIKKEWHDIVVEEFLLHIRYAMQHYGFNFKELPKETQKMFGIKKQTPHEAFGIADGKLPGEDGEMPPEAKQTITKRGREAKPFEDFVLEKDKDNYIKRLHDTLSGLKREGVIRTINNHIEGNHIIRPPYNAFHKEFPNIELPETTYYNRIKKNN